MNRVRIQHSRRTNPYPWTWEVPAAVLASLLLAMCLAVHLARAAANLFAGSAWHLTPRPALFSTLPELLGGDAAAGLTPVPAGTASAGALWTWVCVLEVLVLGFGAVLLRSGLRRWGPNRVRGMATPGETEQLLGLSRLRRNAPVIRPDLHDPRRRR